MGVSVVDVITRENVIGEKKITTHFVEVFRDIEEPVEVEKRFTTVDVVKPGATLLNVGAGEEFPDSPFEGQIWVKLL